MNTLEIKDTTIIYNNIYHGRQQNKVWTAHKDNSWSFDLENIIALGAINRMSGDDDSYFLVFIDYQFTKYFIDIAYPIKGYEIFKNTIETTFNICINECIKNLYDREIIIYPSFFTNQKLYKPSYKKWFRRLLLIDHVADGELSDSINNLKT